MIVILLFFKPWNYCTVCKKTKKAVSPHLAMGRQIVFVYKKQRPESTGHPPLYLRNLE
jgi:hypothetical protein